jgi:hypothetical protein
VAAGIAWIEAGFRLVTYSGDIWIFADAMRAGLDAMKAARPE